MNWSGLGTKFQRHIVSLPSNMYPPFTTYDILQVVENDDVRINSTSKADSTGENTGNLFAVSSLMNGYT